MTELAISARGLLGEFHQAGVLDLADVHGATTIGRLGGDTAEPTLLAVALCIRAVRNGSVCLDITSVRAAVTTEVRGARATRDESSSAEIDPDELPWPEADEWRSRLHASPLLAGKDAPLNSQPLRLVWPLLYLERYWIDETIVREELESRRTRTPQVVDISQLDGLLDQLFADPRAARQRDAARAVALHNTVIISGGPGTGKTTTVAKVLACLQSLSPDPLRIALAAPSGKAANRLQHSVQQVSRELPDGVALPHLPSGVTVHRLLGSKGPGRGFSRGKDDPLPHDVVVVDEVSMLALPMMARLLTATELRSTLILIGDPHQLTSVDAGSVLADLVTAIEEHGSRRAELVELTHNWRFEGAIDQLARAVRRGDSSEALQILTAGHPDVQFTHDTRQHTSLSGVAGLAERIADSALAVQQAAEAGDGTAALQHLDRHRVLCAHRGGPWGVTHWGRLVQEHIDSIVPPTDRSPYPVGRPLLLTRNMAELGLFNGDTGVVVRHGDLIRVAMGDPKDPRLLSPYLLDQVQHLYAMTVHKSQGSQFDDVTLVLPPIDSPLLSRELLYTAITRARSGVHLIGDPDAFVKAVNTPADRTSGVARGW